MVVAVQKLLVEGIGQEDRLGQETFRDPRSLSICYWLAQSISARCSYFSHPAALGKNKRVGNLDKPPQFFDVLLHTWGQF